MRRSPFTHDFLLLFTGPIVWALHFLAIYGFTGIACARALPAGQWLGLGWHAWVLVGAGVLAAAALWVPLQVQPRSESPESRRFLRWVAIGLAALSLLAIAWETLAVFLVPPCSSAV